MAAGIERGNGVIRQQSSWLRDSYTSCCFPRARGEEEGSLLAPPLPTHQCDDPLLICCKAAVCPPSRLQGIPADRLEAACGIGIKGALCSTYLWAIESFGMGTCFLCSLICCPEYSVTACFCNQSTPAFILEGIGCGACTFGPGILGWSAASNIYRFQVAHHPEPQEERPVSGMSIQ
jgi:hypothetical protein